MQRMHLVHRKSEAYSDFVGKSEFLEPIGLRAQTLKFSLARTAVFCWMSLSSSKINLTEL